MPKVTEQAKAHPGEHGFFPQTLTVARVRQETSDTTTLEFDGGLAHTPEPGQFNMLNAYGHGEIPISFSAIGDTGFSHTIRNVGASSRALTRLRPGDRVFARGPFGKPWPTELAAAHDVLVIAGGIGIAPLLPLLEVLQQRRPVNARRELIVGSRSSEDFLFLDRLINLQGWEFHSIVDHAGREWIGQVGVVTDAIPRVAMDPARTVTLVCGPEVMMRHVGYDLISHGFRPEAIFMSMERNMHCAIAHCGRCQWGPHLICRDGPVFDYAAMAPLLRVDCL